MKLSGNLTTLFSKTDTVVWKSSRLMKYFQTAVWIFFFKAPWGKLGSCCECLHHNHLLQWFTRCVVTCSMLKFNCVNDCVFESLQIALLTLTSCGFWSIGLKVCIDWQYLFLLVLNWLPVLISACSDLLVACSNFFSFSPPSPTPTPDVWWMCCSCWVRLCSRETLASDSFLLWPQLRMLVGTMEKLQFVNLM